MTGPQRVAEKQLALSRWNALSPLLRAAHAVGARHAVPDGLARRHSRQAFLRNEPILG